MPWPEDLLNPITGDNPSGHSLRYTPLYDKVKEARREDDQTPQGDWVHERKRADYALVLRLCSDALANQSKDLQLAVWTTEALLKQEGLAGLHKGLDFLSILVSKFWETLYPELEDGDAEFRAASLDWLGSKFSEQLSCVRLTSNGFDWLKYKESRAVGYEADASASEAKKQDRDRAVADGKITAEIFDESLSKTPKVFYETGLGDVNASLTALDVLNARCEGLFGESRPGFSPLRESLEDLRQTINILLQKKREQEPDHKPTPIEIPQPEETVAHIPEKISPTQAEPAEAVTPVQVRVSKEPASIEDAVESIIRATHYLRRERPEDPVPYMLLRALRWGELRAAAEVDSLLEAPATEVRKQLRALAQNGDWQELLNVNEAAMSSPSGRGWLDLQRYAVKASEALGSSYAAVSSAIISGLKALLLDYPELPHRSLTDETPTASNETQQWISELMTEKEEASPPCYSIRNDVEGGASEVTVVDAYELAKTAASAGRPQEAMEILEREAAQERSGRGRFQRNMQLAQVCMAAGHPSIALPMLEALANEIDNRKLEDWEDADMVIHALGLLYQCLEKLKRSPEEKQKVYARICRLRPARALALAG